MKKIGQKNRVIQWFRVIEGRVIEGFYCTALGVGQSKAAKLIQTLNTGGP